MSGPPRAQRAAESLIRAACRRLPADVCEERCREWTAELPAILADQSIRPPLLRTLRVLTFCIGVSRTARRLGRAARAGSRRRNPQWRAGAVQIGAPGVMVRAAAGFAAWLVLVTGFTALLRAYPRQQGWLAALGVALAVALDAFCLRDIVRARQVRYLPKWAWALICLIQAPGGGIAYLSLGHIGQPPPVPPSDATR